ncbi:uncharacterized protein [Tenebrio molitor]|uniref:uncharacterized protein n=1 Tax=Tenebrio molitor TaxID=7067 RepID=UPI0036247C23
MILNFLIMNKFSIERTKQKIDMYYTIKNVIPDVYCNPKSPQIKDFMKDVYVCLHPVPAKGLYRVYWYKIKESNKIQVHQDTEILKELFSAEDLPRDYGGKGPTLQELNDLIMQKFEEYEDRFDQLDKLRVDENLRPEKLNNDEILGFHGNFRKLDVD